MKIYKAKDYQDMSRKAANIISAPGNHKTRLRAGAGYRFYTGRHVCAACGMVQKGRS